MPSECAAVGCCEKLTKDSEFSFHAFPVKNEAKKRQWQAVGRWDAATKKLWAPDTTICYARSISKKKSFTDCTLLSIQFGLKYSVRLKDEAVPTLSAKTNNKNNKNQTGPERRALAKHRKREVVPVLPDESSVRAHPDQTLSLPTRVVL